jgi:hypothetical protein
MDLLKAKQRAGSKLNPKKSEVEKVGEEENILLHPLL